MPGLDLAGQLAILDEALARLEAELARDAAWHALQKGADDAEARAALKTLEASPVFLAWRNMRETANVVRARQASNPDPGPAAAQTSAQTSEAGDASVETSHRTTLAEALQQAGEDVAEEEELPRDIAQLLAAEVAAQTSPGPLARAAHAQEFEEQEQHDVGTRATQAVDRILSIPLVEAVAPIPRAASIPTAFDRPPAEPAAAEPVSHEATAPQPPHQALAPKHEAEDDIGHSVPLEAEDLAFLLSPAPRSRSASAQPPPVPPPAAPRGAAPQLEQGQEQTGKPPFLERLVAEAQTAPTRASILAPPEPFMVPPDASQSVAPDEVSTPPEDAAEASARKPRLARLLKAWSRQ